MVTEPGFHMPRVIFFFVVCTLGDCQRRTAFAFRGGCCCMPPTRLLVCMGPVARRANKGQPSCFFSSFFFATSLLSHASFSSFFFFFACSHRTAPLAAKQQHVSSGPGRQVLQRVCQGRQQDWYAFGCRLFACFIYIASAFV